MLCWQCSPSSFYSNFSLSRLLFSPPSIYHSFERKRTTGMFQYIKQFSANNMSCYSLARVKYLSYENLCKCDNHYRKTHTETDRRAQMHTYKNSVTCQIVQSCVCLLVYWFCWFAVSRIFNVAKRFVLWHANSFSLGLSLSLTL